MRFILLALLFLNVSTLCAQNKTLRAFNSETGKEIIFKENHRIRVVTSSGDRISGKFNILDENHIQIKDHIIELVELVKLKRNPLLASIIINGVLYYTASVTLLAGLAIATIGQAPIALVILLPIAGGLIYTAIKQPNFLKGYTAKSGWIYSIEN